MAVQINEVIIRAVVDPRPVSTGTAQELECPPGSGSADSELVEKVLEIIKEKTER